MFLSCHFFLYAISLFKVNHASFALKEGFVSRKSVFFFYVFSLILKILDFYSIIFNQCPILKKTCLTTSL